MAWQECHLACRANIEERKKELGSLRRAFRAISKESGIPSKTLQRWYWGDLKNEVKKASKIPNKSQFETCRVSDLQDAITQGKQFGTIYADPPWPYQNQATRSCTDDNYSTMTLEDIGCLPISQLALPESHLHLWTTNAFLPAAFEIMRAWGFEYKSCFVWVKEQMGIGNYWRVSHEFLLLGVRGGLRFAKKDKKSWLLAKRGKHSAKPEQVRTAIEQVSPGPYLELFARNTAPHWACWGNEIERTLFNTSVLESREFDGREEDNNPSQGNFGYSERQ